MSEGYTIGRLRGELAIVYYDNSGKRHRYSLGTSDAAEARRLAPSIFAELTGPTSTSVAELWRAYTLDKAGRAILVTMEHTWKKLDARFGKMRATDISVADCRAHAAERREAGIKDWTIFTELGHLRTVLSWAAKRNLIAKAPHIELPPTPKPKDKSLTRAQVRALMDAATYPHIGLFIKLAIGTGARNAALLELTWDRCDFIRGQIDLRNPAITRPHKGRAIVPMNKMVRAALEEAKQGAICEYVVDWGGKQVQSVKKGLKETAKRAGVGGVSPHVLRHTAAVHMAEDGVPMEEIAQYLGHGDINVTRKIYARFSPTYLKRAAASLEY